MITKSTALAALVLGGILLAGGTAITTWPKAPALAQQPGGAAPGSTPADQTRSRRESINHVRQLMLAFHNYHSDHNQFPPAATYGADGKALLSWRVALLPYLGETDLYKEFHQDEPWDSPHNAALILRMPGVFGTPDSPVGKGLTRFRGFEGPGAMFQGTHGVSLQETSDGASNTIMVATARSPVFWTQPGELPYAPGQPLPELDDHDPIWSLVGKVDGATIYLPPDEKIRRQMITRNGGEIVNLTTQSDRESTVPPQPATGQPPAAESVEQRLIRLEQKLDRLIQKVDSQAAGATKP